MVRLSRHAGPIALAVVIAASVILRAGRAAPEPETLDPAAIIVLLDRLATTEVEDRTVIARFPDCPAPVRLQPFIATDEQALTLPDAAGWHRFVYAGWQGDRFEGLRVAVLRLAADLGALGGIGGTRPLAEALLIASDGPCPAALAVPWARLWEPIGTGLSR